MRSPLLHESVKEEQLDVNKIMISNINSIEGTKICFNKCKNFTQGTEAYLLGQSIFVIM